MQIQSGFALQTTPNYSIMEYYCRIRLTAQPYYAGVILKLLNYAHECKLILGNIVQVS